MERSSQLILRNAALLEAGDLLLLNPPPDHLFQHLAARHPRVSICSQDFADYRWFIQQGAMAAFGVVPAGDSLPAQVILFLPREKERLELLLHCLAAGMPAGGSLWLAGANQSGIKSAARRLQRFFAVIAKVDSARHCALLRATQAVPPAPFLLADYQQKWLLGSPPAELRMVSLPGAFAHGRLDRGTELLLQVLMQQQGHDYPRGSVLDFACGIGVIGLSLLLRDPALDLTLLDSSALALESARLSLQANGMQAKLLPSDGLAEVTGRYDWMVSNPPFHRGVATNYDIARGFFAQAHGVLTRQGRILLVCNRHLPYAHWLAEQFTAVETLECSNDFKILRAARPKIRTGAH